MDGAVRMRFRTLTTKEIDTIYKQVFHERDLGIILTPEDYWERINRYRLYLQLTQLISSAFHHDLPDGYDAQSNPHAEGFWEFDPPKNPQATGLPQIELFMNGELLRTETIQRVVNHQCGQFNRLVARLEALVDNSDFWKPIESRS